MEKRVVFKGWKLPVLLVTPQLIISAVFFFYPSGQAIWNSLFLPDPFGLKTQFVGLDNFRFLLTDPYYLASFKTTITFSILVTVSSMLIGLYLAALADRLIKGSGVYQTLLIWPYAIAPAIAGVLWLLDGDQAMFLVVLASAWGRISYNFLFFFAGLQAIPKSVIEAAAIDGASFWKRFATVVLPLLSPITFFLLVVNIVYAFFDTFGVIHTITSGGPEQSTTILVYKVFSDGFVSQDLGSSAAQSVILLILVGILTVVQFKYIERKVHY